MNSSISNCLSCIPDHKKERVEPKVLGLHSQRHASLQHFLAIRHAFVIVGRHSGFGTQREDNRSVGCGKVEVFYRSSALAELDAMGLPFRGYKPKCRLQWLSRLRYRERGTLSKFSLKKFYRPLREFAGVFRRSDVHIQICCAGIQLFLGAL